VVGTLLAVALSASLASAIQARSGSQPRARTPGTLVPIYAGKSTTAVRSTPKPSAAAGSRTPLAATSSILVTYHNFPPAAQAAFQAAVDEWESVVVSSQTIHVDASWQNLGDPRILGEAGATNLLLENDGFWYPAALDEALCGCDSNPGAEIQAEFNSAFTDWYTGTDGNTPVGKWDLETVVLHELGHGLGFFSSFYVPGRKAKWGYTDNSNVNHALRFDANEWDSSTGGNHMTSYSNGVAGSSVLKAQLTDGSVYLGGSHIEAVLGGRAKLYAPSPWEAGSSNSHLDEAKYPTGTINALMTPILYDGEVTHQPGPAMIAIFQDIGWPVAGAAPTAPNPPTSVSATAGDTTAAVSWSAPANDGGSPITGYTATSVPDGLACTTPDVSGCTVNGLTNGTQYTFTVTATNGVGTSAPSATSNAVVPHAGSTDVTAPVVDALVMNIVAPQTVRPTQLVNVSWPAASDASGIASYELQRQIGAGPWTGVSLSSPTATTVQIVITRGSNMAFRVRATDGASNVGQWTTTTTKNLGTVQETTPGLAFVGSWARVASSGASGRYVTRSTTADSTATFTFTGTSVAFVSTLARGRGIAEITLDGIVVATVDLYATTKTPRAVVWAPDAALAAGTHTVTIRVTGTKNASATSTRVDVDGFLVWP